VLSLKASSAMVGALGMEERCVRLERALIARDRAAAATAGEGIERHRPQLEKALGATARHTA
ncbi:MAG TPA: hypothetical protein VJQ60_08275, partial [Arthrobacter sp.]|nr:hypothetical protein [Arthrobacter sp.]